MSLPRPSPTDVPANHVSGEFSQEERSLLLRLAHESIISALENREISLEPPTAHLAEARGAFTSIYLDSHLRGCVGYVLPIGPVYRAVAETARAAAVDAARQAQRQLAPVSVLISRKTQKLYVRQSFEPIFDAPITIADPDRPIGTHVFTAVDRASADAPVRWNVVTLESPQGDDAKAALDRITIPQDVLDRIPGVSPRSSLIVTDEPPSSETGKGTDFVILLSDQPQGGIKFRKHGSSPEISYNGGGYYTRPPRDFMTYWGPQSRPGSWCLFRQNAMPVGFRSNPV